jgi:hypothetical protein
VVGESLGPIRGEFLIPSFGRKALSLRFTVVEEETVRVPAGVFRASKVQTTPVELGTGYGKVLVKYAFWYSAQSLRPIKITFDTVSHVGSDSTSETYELQGFVAGK